MTELWAILDKAVGIADGVVTVGVPMAALLVAVRFQTRRKSHMWRGLAVFFGLITVSGVAAAFMKWSQPQYLSSLVERGLPVVQLSLELMKRQVPLVVLSLLAGLVLVGVVIRLQLGSTWR